jgi:PadR family transcriptional regulator, regulatory protein PadR
MDPRLTRQTLLLLSAFLRVPQEWKYGYDMSRSTGLKSGTLYPILMRLAQHRLLETSWETIEQGRPPRHLYRLTAEGLRFAREHVPQTPRRRTNRVAYGGAKA